MLSGYIVNVESTRFAGHATDDHIPVAADQGLIVQRPADVDGQIALDNGALNAHRFAGIGGLVAKVKGSNLWGNCGMGIIVGYFQNQNKLQMFATRIRNSIIM